MGISTSRLCDRRAYRGTIDGEYRMRSPSAASRSRTRGWRTATGPMPVMISRCGRWPWRTTRCRPVSVLRSLCFARNSATSASTAWVSSARAPLRRISVRESAKAPGWASLMTLLSDTAYHSFIGEVEALNTTTIRRLTRSRRHQLLAIARAPEGGDDVEVAFRGDGIDVGCRASVDRRDHPHPRGPEGEIGANPVVLAPGRCPVEIDIRAKSDGVDRLAHRRFERRDARAVDQRDVFVGRRVRLAPRISKGVPWRLEDAQRSIHHVAEEIREEFGDQPASLRLGH